MNGSQNGKNRSFEMSHPGCLGRMVNLFELNIGASPNRLLTNKPHLDGLPVSRSRSDVSSMSPSLDQIEDKVIVSDYTNTFSNKKSNVTPMKMLIAQEMCKEVDSRRSPPNLVAKLMGLDSLPQQEPTLNMQRSRSKGHPRRHSDIPMSNWEQQNGFFHCVEQDEYKDVYEIWQQSKKFSCKGRCNETSKDEKMAFVRQKFVEAKRLSMDEKLRQSKQFQDALEVLSSDKDLFLKCLQEPNSVFSQQLYDLQSIPPPEMKRITVLKPSKMTGSHDVAGNREDKQMDTGAFVHLNSLGKGHLGSSPSANWKDYQNHAQPTRIVVLKPSLGKILDDEAAGSPQSKSARLHGEEFFGDEEDNENQEAREVAKVNTQQMHEKLGRHHRDETLISSVFSTGYAADESSFNRSEIEYPPGNLSDSETVSPVSRHSWDYVNRLGSPYSSSSFSRASYSPESSVCREAKKRLSERWAMMASTGGCQEQKHVRRSSSTLGEMLSLSEAKKVALPREEGSSSNQESKDANSLLFSEGRTDRNVDSSTINLTRSKSLPVSSTQLGTRLNAGVSVSNNDKVEIAKEDIKIKVSKSSFKGKVSSFFSSRNKKTTKEKFPTSEPKDECRFCPGDVGSGKTENLIDQSPNSLSDDLPEPPNKVSSSNIIFKQGLLSPEACLSGAEPIASGISSENQDQPSPVSVLDPPFEECDRTAKVFAHFEKLDQRGYKLPDNLISSNLIDKSPPIGSIARTLSWDDSFMDTASSYPTKDSLTTQGTEGEREWFLLVETLLSAAGLQDNLQLNSFLARWHSPESPLNPSLRDKYIDLTDKDKPHVAKRRQKRSMQKLVFDCVNAVLVEIAGCGSGPAQRPFPANTTLVDEVWARMGGWFSDGTSDGGDENSVVVERAVGKEVVGRGWVDKLRLEVDNLVKEIEGQLMEELVVELTGRE